MFVQLIKPKLKFLVGAAVLLPLTIAIATPAFAQHGPNRQDQRDYQGHRGYRMHPYNKQRHYEHHEYGGHQYKYEGHWRSWRDWDDYYRSHPKMHQDGHYYREQGHLMFRYCEPGTGNCFFFSIGM